MKNISKPVILVIIILLIIAYSAAYTINEAEQVVVVRFGEVRHTETEPGLHFKTPFIDDAMRFEKRWLAWDGEPNQITTLDKRYIHIDVFARWRISNVRTFIEVLRDEDTAQGRLDDIIDSATRNVVANHNLIEAIRTSTRSFQESDEERLLTRGGEPKTPSPVAEVEPEPDEQEGGEKAETTAESSVPVADSIPEQINRKSFYAIQVGRDKLTRLILEKATSKAAQLGIELKDVQFKRIDYIQSVRDKVFDRMISERKRVAEAFRSQGRGRAAEILGRTEKELKKIQSEAYRQSEEIKGHADAQAAAIYARAYKRDPELYNFLKTLESYEHTVNEDTWMLLSTDADYARHLRTMKRAGR
ncbi:MAG: protease modulator HflC [Proteobacteria bacterium]|nr:protease modulator HflC [Pseudomonadota bacterium]